MSKKQNDFHFDIPIPVIIIALICSFPIGVILAVLRLVSSSDGNKELRDGKEKLENTIDHLFNKTDAEKREVRENVQATKRSSVSSKKRKNGSKRSSGTILSGVVCALFFVLGLFGLLASFSDGIGQIPGNFIRNVVPFMTVSGIAYLFSVFFKDRDSRLNRIRAMIGDKDSFRLSRIAAVSKDSVKKVRKDVQYLIDKGEFGDEAFVDLSSDMFMRNSDAEPDSEGGFDYRTLYDEKVFGKDSRKGEAPPETSDNSRKGEEAKEQDHFRAVILEIRHLNDEIHDFAVSERIYRIEEYTQYIFDYVTDHPEAMPKIRTFLNYYLPTTMKLLESYRRIEHMGVAGENMKSSKEKIESILDLLVEGFKQQMDNLFQNESMDISSDISVLETMMQKDGLSGNRDFVSTMDFDFGGMAAQPMPTDTETDIK